MITTGGLGNANNGTSILGSGKLGAGSFSGTPPNDRLLTEAGDILVTETGDALTTELP